MTNPNSRLFNQITCSTSTYWNNATGVRIECALLFHIGVLMLHMPFCGLNITFSALCRLQFKAPVASKAGMHGGMQEAAL